MPPLPPTSPDLLRDDTRLYFTWWDDVTVGGLKARLASPDADQRAYWLGALLREANSRDVWLFVRPGEVRAAWPLVARFVGRHRAM